MTPEELTARLKEAEAERDALRERVAERDRQELIRAEGSKLAAQGLAAAQESAMALNEAIAEEARRQVAALAPYGYATAAEKVIVTPQVVVPGGLRRYGNLSKANRQLVDIIMGRKTAMTSVTDGAGDDWVPHELGEELLGLVDVVGNLHGFIREIPMRSDTYKLPALTAHMTIYHAPTQNAGATADGSPTTGDITFTAHKFIGQAQLSTELDEDAIVDTVDLIKRDCAFAIAQAEESAMVWGDDTSTAANNIDKNVSDGAGAGLGTSAQQAFNGIYYTAKSGGATVWFAYATDWATTIRALRAAMGKYGTNPKNCLVIMSPAVFGHVVGTTAFQTWDKVGAAASALTGLLPNPTAASPLGMFDGMFVTQSGFMYDTDATGVRLTTAASNTKHTVAIVNYTRLLKGRRRNLTIKVWDYPVQDTRYVICTSRMDLQFVDAAASGAYVAAYNG